MRRTPALRIDESAIRIGLVLWVRVVVGSIAAIATGRVEDVSLTIHCDCEASPGMAYDNTDDIAMAPVNLPDNRLPLPGSPEGPVFVPRLSE